MTFEEWWLEIGSGVTVDRRDDREEHARKVAAQAWCAAIDAEINVDVIRYRFLRSSDTSVGVLAKLVRNAHSENRFDAAVDEAMRSNVEVRRLPPTEGNGK